MNTTNAYWVKVNGKMVTRTGAELVELYRYEYERNTFKENLTEETVTLKKDLDGLRKELVAAAERNIALREDNGKLTRRVQELEQQLEDSHEVISRLTGVAQTHVKRRMATEEGKARMANCRCVEAPLIDPLDGVKACQGSRADFEALFKAPMEMAVATGKLSDRAVDAIIADVMKSEPTAADYQLADDIYSLRRRIACDLRDWSQAVEPVLSRLAAAEHVIKLQNELRRGVK